MGATAIRKGMEYRKAASSLTTAAMPINANKAPIIAETFVRQAAFVRCSNCNLRLTAKLISKARIMIAYSLRVPPYKVGRLWKA